MKTPMKTPAKPPVKTPLSSTPTVFFSLMRTKLGFVALAWSGRGLCLATFPHSTAELCLRALAGMAVDRGWGVERARGARPEWVVRLEKKLRAEHSGSASDSVLREEDSFPVDFSGVPEFHRRVYLEAMKIPRGKTRSYSALAAGAGSPRAARAVGQAMAKNPMPLVIPCHRVLAAGGKLGGFTAPGGLASKSQLLALEGAETGPRTFPRGFDAGTALAELSRQDPRLGRLIKKVGPFRLKIDRSGSPYEWLLRSIIYQQLNARAAATIHSRVRGLFGDRDPSPKELLAKSEALLSAAGLSRNKLAALKDLARFALEGQVPDRKRAQQMSDEELIESLIRIRGVGRWTVEMLLIFGLGRCDVLAVDDFALKKSAMLLHGLDAMPDRNALRLLGVRWKPWRTIASWYLWRALDT
jgi:O-6-methylguanine DNA methyltransferase